MFGWRSSDAGSGSVNHGFEGYAAAIVNTIADECRRDG